MLLISYMHDTLHGIGTRRCCDKLRLDHYVKLLALTAYFLQCKFTGRCSFLDSLQSFCIMLFLSMIIKISSNIGSAPESLVIETYATFFRGKTTLKGNHLPLQLIPLGLKQTAQP